MSGLVRITATAVLLSLAAAAGVHAEAALPVRRWSPGDPQLSERLRATGNFLLSRRAELARGFPGVISLPGADWSPEAHRRSGYRATPGPLRSIRNSTSNAPGVAAGPPQVVHVAFIRVDFANDRGGSASTGNGRFNLDPADSVNNPVDRPPHNRTFFRKHHEALARYYDAMSYGRVQIVGTVWPSEENKAYTVSDMADLGPWKFSQDIQAAAVHMFKTFAAAADTQSIDLGDPIPWSTIDRVVFIHAGSDLQSDVRQDSKEDIPSFTMGVSDSSAAILTHRGLSPPDTLFQCTFVPETSNQDGYYGANNGVIAHECGHLIFGYVDLYNVDTGFPVVGLFSLMDSGNLAGAIVKLPDGEEIFATGLLPPSVDPFHRFFTTDALTIPEVTYGAVDSLRNSERFPDMRRLSLSSDEYLLLENRYLSAAPSDSVKLDQDDTTRVVLGPKLPDKYEYDSLTPGGGILVWHVDESVIPFSNSLRPNPGYGVNTSHSRRGVSVVEADGLDDIGDIGSPFLLGSYRDPWYVGNNMVLDDDTQPNLRPNLGTRPHARFEVLDTLKATMRFRADRAWQLPGWPIAATGQFPPGGPQLLAVDADGDGKLDVCWAGAGPTSPDSTALFAVRPTGLGLGSSRVVTAFDRRPFPVAAALTLGGPRPEQGPALFAVSTYADANLLAGGQVWLVDHDGFTYGAGWPATLPATHATTPPIFVGSYPNAVILVGAADGFVYALNLDGTVWAVSPSALPGGVTGRLAASVDESGQWRVSAGGARGAVTVFQLTPSTAAGISGASGAFTQVSGWPQQVSSRIGFTPDFLWVDLDGVGGAAGDPSGCGVNATELVVHDADRLWAYCPAGRLLNGWGRSLGDTLAPGLGAGDPDGDGFPEVLVQTQNSKVAFVNLTGGPSPGWPKPGSGEGALNSDTLLTGNHTIDRFPTLSPPLSIDVDGGGRSSVVALNTSGIIAALGPGGRQPQGWPLATGSGTSGAPLAADLDRNGTLDLVAPDRSDEFSGKLYAYTLPADTLSLTANSWTMLGGDPERTCWLPAARTSIARAPTTGPLVGGTCKAFPNPARRHPVTFAYTLTQPARVEFRILDTSGHQVASFQRDGRIAENLETWEPGAVPAGLYLVHMKFVSQNAEATQVIQVGVLK